MPVSLDDDARAFAAASDPSAGRVLLSKARAKFGRLTVMLGGEAMQSALSFALNLALLHKLPAKEYGVFALVLVIGGIALTYIRALTAMPAAILIGRHPGSSRARAYAVTFGSTALLLSVLIAAGVGAAFFVWIEHDALAGGLFVGLWAMRSHLRSALFADGRQRTVALSDLTYVVSGCATAAPILFGSDVLRDVLLILALANALAIAVMLIPAGTRPRVSLRPSVRRRYGHMKRQIGWSILGVTTMNFQGQGLAFMVAVLAGPAAYAPIAAALVMFVPLRLIGNALANMMQPDLSARLGRGEIGTVWHSGLAWMGITILCSLAYGGLMLVVFRFVAIPFPDTAFPKLVLFLAWFFNLLVLASVMPRITLEIFGAFRAITLIATGSAILGLGVGYAILSTADPSLALAGGAFSEFAVLVLSLGMVWHRKRRLTEGRPYPSLFQAARPQSATLAASPSPGG